MGERALRNNFFFILLKFIVFLLIFCFLIQIAKAFALEVWMKQGLQSKYLLLSILSCFGFYIFIFDVNDFYKKFQGFFFRSAFLSFCISALLVFLGFGYFILPRILDASFDKNLFLFLGGFVLTAQLIFVARETKGTTLADFIHYLFIFSILFIVNLVIFSAYLRVAFKIDILDFMSRGIKEGADLIKTLVTQITGK